MSLSDDSGASEAPPTMPPQRPIHAALGGGKVADVLLWRDIKLSAAFFTGILVIWFLFEVVEFTLLTLFCYLFITTMLVIFIWSIGAEIFGWKPPEVPNVFLDESAFQEVAAILHPEVNSALSNLFNIACGNDIKLFVLVMISLLFLSAIGNYISSLNLLFFGLLCLATLPFLYELYKTQVDKVAEEVNQRVGELYKKFDSDVLGKIPRGPGTERRDS